MTTGLSSFLLGGRHRRSTGHAHVRRVFSFLQDDVHEAGPVPAADGVQREEGPPDSRRADSLPAKRTEGGQYLWRQSVKFTAC